jgi:hypothetical protein
VPDVATDPLLARRARIATAVSVGQRLGYGLFLVAIIAFAVGALSHFTPLLVNIVVGALLVGSLVLAPAIVAGYAVKAAEREDRGLSSGH